MSDNGAAGRTTFFRSLAGVLVSLLLSLAVLYPVFLMAVSVGFDGPSSMSFAAATGWVLLGISVAFVGLAGGWYAGWFIAGNSLAPSAGVVPGIIGAGLLLSSLAWEVYGKT